VTFLCSPSHFIRKCSVLQQNYHHHKPLQQIPNLISLDQAPTPLRWRRKNCPNKMGTAFMTLLKGEEEGTPQTTSHPIPICKKPKKEHKPNWTRKVNTKRIYKKELQRRTMMLVSLSLMSGSTCLASNPAMICSALSCSRRVNHSQHPAMQG